MASQSTLDLVHQVDAPAGSVLIVHVPLEQKPPELDVVTELAKRTGLLVFVFHGVTLETVNVEQMAAAGWVPAPKPFVPWTLCEAEHHLGVECPSERCSWNV